MKKYAVTNVCIGYPPFEYNRGIPLISPNRQFQWLQNPTYIYPVISATAATMLKNAGYSVYFLDAISRNITTIKWFEYLDEMNPDLIFFEVKTPIINYIWDVVDSLKDRYANIKIALAGDHVTALPEESINNSKVDFVLTGGDYDFLLLNLVEHLNGKEKLDKGIYYRKNGKIENTGTFELKHSLENIPFIDRDLTEWKLYAYRNDYFKKFPATYIMAGRGSWYNNLNCYTASVMYNSFRLRNPINVVDEIEVLHTRYKLREIIDDTGCFPVGEWLSVFCQTMKDRRLSSKVVLNCNMRFGALSFLEYKLMKRAGFRSLIFGLESGNQATLDRMCTDIKVEDILISCKEARRSGLSPHITVKIGYPWENEEDINRTFELTKTLMSKGYANAMQAIIMIPYPGTRLFDECKRDNLLITENWSNYDMRETVMKTDLGDERIKTYLHTFYNMCFNPFFIIHKILSIRDIDDIKYYIRSFKNVFFGHLKYFE